MGRNIRRNDRARVRRRAGALLLAAAAIVALPGTSDAWSAPGGNGGAGDGRGALLTGDPRLDFFGAGLRGPAAGTASGLVAGPVRGAVSAGDSRGGGVFPAAASFQDAEGEGAAGMKSPWLAAVLSLAVPGAGEIYAGEYLKGGLFFAAEAAMWGIAWKFDGEGDDLTDQYKAYANVHYSVTRYVDWTLGRLGSLNPELTTSADEYRDRIYPDDSPPCDPPFSCVDWVELNAMERDIAAGRLNGYTHTLPYYGEQQYYELIGKYEQFSRGWDDAGSYQPERENDVPIRNTSLRFREYSQMRARANDKYDVASTFVSLAVVNHVLSAIDAFWSVSKLNRSLQASVRVRMQRSPAGSAPVTTASVRYTF